MQLINFLLLDDYPDDQVGSQRDHFYACHSRGCRQRKYQNFYYEWQGVTTSGWLSLVTHASAHCTTNPQGPTKLGVFQL